VIGRRKRVDCVEDCARNRTALKLVTWHTDAHDAPYAAISECRVATANTDACSRDHRRGRGKRAD
jgi:hypothetical protein